jgi:predicted CXXCH cytochrome family protein
MIKRVKATTWLAGMMFVLAGLFGGEALAAIASTKHNLSSSGSANAGQTIYSDQTEICIFCHTPHAAIKNDTIPLWNHSLSQVGVGANPTYTMYTSPTFDAGTQGAGLNTILNLGGATTANASASNLCLSCHDGTVAINSFQNPSNQNPLPNMVGTAAGGLMQAGATNLGTDLSTTHPVNFLYDAALFGADPTLNNPASLTGVRLYAGRVQCASCHDPHTSQDPSGRSFLRVTMASSGLCMACHNK